MKILQNEELQKLTTPRLRSLQKKLFSHGHWGYKFEGVEDIDDVRPEYLSEYKNLLEIGEFKNRIKAILNTRPHIPKKK